MSKVLLCYEDFSELMSTQTVLKKVGFDVLPISSEFGLTQQVLSFNPDIVVGYGKGPKVSTVGVGRRLKEMPRWTGSVVLIFPTGSKPMPSDLARIRMDMALEAPLEITRLLQVLANFTNQDPHLLIERMMKSAAQDAANSQNRAAADAAAKDSAVFVTGAKDANEAWNVKGGQELDDFNRLMGVPGTTAPGTQAKSPRGAAGTPDTQFVTSGLEGIGPAQTVGSQPERAPGDSNADPGASVREQLHKFEATVGEKVKSYEKFLAQPVPVSESTLKRTETRKAQKDLRKDWPEEELKDQDKLRRSFTKALFKKKD